MSSTSFDLHGEQFWDKNGPYRTLHHINPARLAFIKRHITLKEQKILDIGCGGGILSEALAKEGAQTYGIDLSENVIKAARAHNPNINYRQITSADCVKNQEQYDHITCMEMLEHVRNPSRILKDIYQLLKPNGYAFLSTLNRTLKSRIFAITLAEKILKLIPQGTHDHQAFIRPHELIQMAEQIGFQAIELSGMDYHPLLKTAVLSQNLKINYLLALKKSP